MADSIIREVRVSMTALAELLNLPKGTEVAAVRQGEFGVAEFLVADPAGKLTGSRAYNKDKKKWVKVPEKGQTRGHSRKVATTP